MLIPHGALRERPPSASVIIPVHNHADLTKQCLDAILEVGADVDYELIVVDDASTDWSEDLLRAYGQLLRTVTHRANAGFARSCNDGAATASGEFLVFLNNDTIPLAGWLDSLTSYAAEHPRAAVIGSKLLFPDDTVQHAGVAICQDGWARHIYAGFPAEHPAVSKSRRFQVVTAACALVRRHAFRHVGGFDETFRNGHEDVDLCLKLGELGYEIHFCHESVVYHVESASRGTASVEIDENGRLYYERWAGSAVRDDLAIYAADGLLQVRYDRSPLQIGISPELASALEPADSGATDTEGRVGDAGSATDLYELADADSAHYDRVKQRVLQLVEQELPAGSSVIVASKGDDSLVSLGPVRGTHFPTALTGGYAGHHPQDGAAAVAELERAREGGASYFLVPATSFWWFRHYEELTEHLRTYPLVLLDSAACVIFNLAARIPAEPDREAAASGGQGDELAGQIRKVVHSLLPENAGFVLADGVPGSLLLAGDRKVAQLSLDPPEEERDGALLDQHSVERLRCLQEDGFRYLVIPATRSHLLDPETAVGAYVSNSTRLIAARENVCRIFELFDPAERPTIKQSSRE